MSQPSFSQSDSSRRRLIVTLGPTSFGRVSALAMAGATELRLNASHLSPEEVGHHCRAVREELPELRCVVDLQGKKMRIGVIEPRQLDAGAKIVLSAAPTTPGAVFVPHPELFAQAAVGERLSLDDGRIEIEVTKCDPTQVIARVLRSGRLLPRKGLNRIDHPIELTDLSVTDQATIAQCRSIPGVDFAVSFASDGLEASWVRTRAADSRVILKIERQEAVENLAELAKKADELWICRGDLGAQLGLSAMARRISAIDPRAHTIPILMAGQVLEHLTRHDTPTRSEVCHLTDLVLRGYAGVVLSDETAIGVGPETATRWAAELMREATAVPS